MPALDRQLDYPFGFDPRGRSRLTGAGDHVRDLIEQVLFTAPGERLNRPDFGTPIKDLVFEGLSDALVATTEQMVHGALLRWLDSVISVESVTVEAVDSQLTVTVVYMRRGEAERRSDVFERQVGG
ncbi:GPW/gp25 family protein [Tropicimonas sp. IMCC34043]|uniref:GPW/gp25 family protein n=1 Tax=Tropicimonas sp. IMCC34043 TaxID=2248760 RepID=UPI000E251330|nr:GPW/gp25 family protein [Tropicimonas sp. IMCC34043]